METERESKDNEKGDSVMGYLSPQSAETPAIV